MTTDPVWAGITEKRPLLRSAEKCFFWPKMHLNPKKQPKFLKRLMFIWEKATYLFEQLLPVVARTWLGEKSDSLFLAKKSDFCHTTPILVDDPFLALGMTVNFPPWKPFFDFPFRRYSCFKAF